MNAPESETNNQMDEEQSQCPQPMLAGLLVPRDPRASNAQPPKVGSKRKRKSVNGNRLGTVNDSDDVSARIDESTTPRVEKTRGGKTRGGGGACEETVRSSKRGPAITSEQKRPAKKRGRDTEQQPDHGDELAEGGPDAVDAGRPKRKRRAVSNRYEIGQVQAA
jgi:hypothetical protein